MEWTRALRSHTILLIVLFAMTFLIPLSTFRAYGSRLAASGPFITSNLFYKDGF